MAEVPKIRFEPILLNIKFVCNWYKRIFIIKKKLLYDGFRRAGGDDYANKLNVTYNETAFNG